MLEITINENILKTTVSGKLTTIEIRKINNSLRSIFKTHDKARWLYIMHDMQGWQPKAFMEEVIFDLQHFNDFEKIAMVGEERWQEWMTKAMSPFTTASVRYFSAIDEQEALAWISD